MPPRNWLIRLQDILEAIEKNKQYTRGMSFKKFLSDNKTIDAVLRNFMVIGEAANNVPEKIKTKYSQVPWKKMVGMRNFVVHEYFGVSYEILWRTLKHDLPKLVVPLKKIVKEAQG